VLRAALSPAHLSHQEYGGAVVRDLVTRAAAAVSQPYRESSALVLRRGPYRMAAGLAESGKPAARLTGRYVDLFDASLPVVSEGDVDPRPPSPASGSRRTLSTSPHVLAAGCRVREETYADGRLRFVASGIADTDAVVRIATTRAPTSVRVGDEPAPPSAWDLEADTLRLRFRNRVEGVDVEVRFEVD